MGCASGLLNVFTPAHRLIIFHLIRLSFGLQKLKKTLSFQCRCKTPPLGISIALLMWRMKPFDLPSFARLVDKPAIIVGVAVVLTAVLMNLEFNSLEAKLYDFRMMKGMAPKPDSQITLVTLDDQTVQSTGEFSPLPLDLHVKFLESLESYSPKAIGYLVNLNHVNQVNPDLFEGEWGPRFVESARRFESRGVPVILGTPFDVTGEVIPPYPLSSLSHSIAVIHRDGNVFSGDKTTRRALVELYGRPAFHLALARATGLGENYSPRGTFLVPEADGTFFFFRYHDTAEKQDPFKYTRVSFSDILQKKVPREAIDGKILLVGTYNRQNPADSAISPYAEIGANTPKLTVHANILDSMMRNDSVVQAPGWVTALMTFLLVLFVVTWIVQAPPLNGLAASVGLAAGFLLLGHLLFHGFGTNRGYWINESVPLMGILFGYYFIVPYRLIREHQKRSSFQRRNEVLMQVEELKTNFLSLVTHDLKTPVAKIQGLAEVLLRNTYDRLFPKDIDTVQNIIHSTEDLNRFITSILELTKAESKNFKLQLESKDVNQLIEQSIEGFQTHAKSKDIRIQSNLEPLFPVKIDPKLMSKVINNLIDNAIKYSPQGSDVVVSSRELKDRIEISVQDQGDGISEEDRKSLFTRFFRGQNEVTKSVSGTGLGLYLTKYFVEAHQGQVEVDSLPGKGSTFRIRLPLNLELSDKENSYVSRTRSG